MNIKRAKQDKHKKQCKKIIDVDLLFILVYI